jgi:hypothetical protein
VSCGGASSRSGRPSRPAHAPTIRPAARTKRKLPTGVWGTATRHPPTLRTAQAAKCKPRISSKIRRRQAPGHGTWFDTYSGREASSFKNLRTIFRVLCPQTAGARHSIFQASNRVRRELGPQRGTSTRSLLHLGPCADTCMPSLGRFLLAARERNEPFRALATLMLRELSFLVNRPVRDPHDLSHSYGSCVVIDWLHYAHGRVPGRGCGVGGQT